MLKRSVLTLLVLVFLVGCASFQMTPQRNYYEAQTLLLNAWTSYHNAWLAIPDDSPKKKEWTQKYHPKFLKAYQILLLWKLTPSGPAPEGFDAAMDEVEQIIFKLLLK